MFARAGMGWSQAPHPREPQPHVPEHRDPDLRFGWVGLVGAMGPGLLLGILGGPPVTVVGCAERALVGNGARGTGARAIKGNGDPRPDLIERPRQSSHVPLKGTQDVTDQGCGPRDQSAHKALIGGQGRSDAQGVTPLEGVFEGPGERAGLGPSPTESLDHQLGGCPCGVAVWSDPRQPSGRQQPRQVPAQSRGVAVPFGRDR
jgi:hypothetical protein